MTRALIYVLSFGSYGQWLRVNVYLKTLRRIAIGRHKLSSDIVVYNYLIEFYTVEILLKVIVISWLNFVEQDLSSIYFKYSCD